MFLVDGPLDFEHLARRDSKHVDHGHLTQRVPGLKMNDHVVGLSLVESWLSIRKFDVETEHGTIVLDASTLVLNNKDSCDTAE